MSNMLNNDEATRMFQELVQAGQKLLVTHKYSEAGVMNMGPSDVVAQGEHLQDVVHAFLVQCDAFPHSEDASEEE